MTTADNKTIATTLSGDKFVRLNELPSLPVLLMEALQLLNSNDNSQAIADKIAQDPPMTAKILRIANSPFYGRPREIGSIREAIVLLGLNQIRDLLLGVCFSNAFPSKLKEINYSLFWRHSMAVADCSRNLAAHSGMDGGMAFTAGLLHDIGRLIMITLYTDAYRELFNEPGSPLQILAKEQQLLGFDHTQIGLEAARRWNFPVTIQEAIARHQTPPLPNTQISPALLVYTANLLIAKTEQADDADLELPQAINAALALLAVTSEQATEWTDKGLVFADRITAVL